MRYIIILGLTACFIVLTTSCRDRNNSKKIAPLIYDTTTIAIFQLDSTKQWATPYSTPATLTQDEMNILDSLVNDCIKSHNEETTKRLEEIYKFLPVNLRKPDLFLIDLHKYKRQYMPYIDNNHQKIVHLNFFCDDRANWKIDKLEPGQKFGNCFFSLKVDLSSKQYKDFYIYSYVG